MAWTPPFFVPQPQEEKIFVLRKHWIELFRIAFFGTLFAVLPFVSLPFARVVLGEIHNAHTEQALLALALSAYALGVLIFIAYAFVDYWLDVWVVTNRRILHVEQKGLFRREIDELELSRVQDVTSEIEGIIPTLLRYGTLSLQTAGEKPRFVFHNIPSPDHVQAVIMTILKAARNADHV